MVLVVRFPAISETGFGVTLKVASPLHTAMDPNRLSPFSERSFLNCAPPFSWVKQSRKLALTKPVSSYRPISELHLAESGSIVLECSQVVTENSQLYRSFSVKG